MMPIVDPSDLIGITFSMGSQEDGQQIDQDRPFC
jgi:hypothetical protein